MSSKVSIIVFNNLVFYEEEIGVTPTYSISSFNQPIKNGVYVFTSGLFISKSLLPTVL